MLLDGILYFWFFLFWKQLFQIKCSYIYSKIKSNSCKNIKRAKLGREEKFKAQNQLQPHWILCHVIQMSRNSQTTRSSYHFGYLFKIIIGRIIDTSHILIISIRLMLHKKRLFHWITWFMSSDWWLNYTVVTTTSKIRILPWTVYYDSKSMGHRFLLINYES